MVKFEWIVLLVSIPLICCANLPHLLAELGESCGESDSCETPYTECVAEQCQCISGYIADNDKTKCLKVATGYESPCEVDAQCSEFLGTGATCEASKCICGNSYHYLHGLCHQTVGPNESCENNDECYSGTEYQATSCDQGTCICSDGFYLRGRTTCRRQVTNIGDECLIDYDCVVENGTCVLNQCQSDSESFNVKRTRIVRTQLNDETRIIIGDDCESDDDCTSIGNSVCDVDKKCICSRAHFPSEGNIGCIPEIGEECDPSTESLQVEHAVCRENTWTCPIDRVATKNNRECQELTKTINGACSNAENCRLFGPNAECLYDTCQCNMFDEYVESKNYCWNSEKDGIELGTYCRKENDCFTKDSICIYNECSCKDYHVNEDGQCLKQLQADCEDSSECSISNSECQKNKCTCEKYHFALDGECAKGIYANCRETSECKVSGSQCLEDQCQCSSGYTTNSNSTKCLKVAIEYEDSCEVNEQCSSFLGAGGICENSKCVCDNSYHYLHGQCYLSIHLFELCGNNDECYEGSEYQASFCDKGLCKCSDGFYPRGRTACRRQVKNVGDECLIDYDCNFENGTCISNQCEIGVGANVKSVKIVKRFSNREARIAIGDDCDKDEDCGSIANSICHVDKKCICKKAHFSTDDKTGCIPEIGEACNSTAESLQVEHAVCRENMWTCPIDRIATKNNRECKELTQTIDGACTAVEDCRLFGPNAECLYDTCKCGFLDEYLESKSYCWDSEMDGPEMGTYCKKENDCLTKGSFCKNNECSCKDYHLDEDGQCLKLLKADCEDTSECSISNSQCENKKCTCEQYHFDLDGQCAKGINAKCEKTSECMISYSECQNEKCTCEKYHFELKGQCLKGLHATCQMKDDCKADNTECQESEQICKCKKNTVAVPDDTCLPISQYQKECKYDVQCSSALPNTFCKNATAAGGARCECLAKHHFKNNKCYPSRVVKDTCKESEECVTKNSHCNNGKCECLAAFPNFVDNTCNLSEITRPFFSFVVFAFLGLKLLS